MELSESIGAPKPEKRLVVLADMHVTQQALASLERLKQKGSVDYLCAQTEQSSGRTAIWELCHFLQWDTPPHFRLRGNAALDDFVKDVSDAALGEENDNAVMLSALLDIIGSDAFVTFAVDSISARVAPCVSSTMFADSVDNFLVNRSRYMREKVRHRYEMMCCGKKVAFMMAEQFSNELCELALTLLPEVDACVVLQSPIKAIVHMREDNMELIHFMDNMGILLGCGKHRSEWDIYDGQLVQDILRGIVHTMEENRLGKEES